MDLVDRGSCVVAERHRAYDIKDAGW
jgi:hypothetical protein